MTPLGGLKVLDLSRVLAGPFAGQTLADLGAEVIKVEAPAGDETRGWGPPFIDRDVDDKADRTAAYFFAANRGKRSVVLDFADAGDLEVVRRLAREADVVIENFRRGGLAKFGLDYDSLSADSPGLVYCSITGFGQDGPHADRPGYDYLIQGMSGLMSITGSPDGEPMRVGVAVTDLFSGLYAVIGIQAALAARARTGTGQHVDIALFDSAVAMLANQTMNYFATSAAPGRIGNVHPSIVPYQVFPVADGHIIIAAGNDGQFARLCGALGLDALPSDPDFARNADRVTHRARLVPIIAGATADWTGSELIAALTAARVPAGPINSIAEALADPQIAARGLEVAPGGVPGIRTPLTFSGMDLSLDRPAPGLGQHSGAVRAGGFAAETDE